MELGGYSKKHPFIQIMQKAENDCYRYVDTVVSMLPKAEEHMREHGLGKGKFHYVPNGIVYLIGITLRGFRKNMAYY